MPPKFVEVLGNSRVRVIIDGFEIKIMTSKDPVVARTHFSPYKQAYTIKLLVGLSPCGFISYLSEAFPGSISDPALVVESKFLELLSAGDDILADKGNTTLFIFVVLSSVGRCVVVSLFVFFLSFSFLSLSCVVFIYRSTMLDSNRIPCVSLGFLGKIVRFSGTTKTVSQLY